MMDRRSFIASIAVLVAPLAAEAQHPKAVPRVGFLSTADQSSPSMRLRLDAFRQGLREFGYVDGSNIAIEYRSARGNPDRLPGLAAELVRLKVDCIVTAGDTPARAAKQATSSIPIVMANPSNPVQAGLVASLARPGGNVTGLTEISTDLAGKRLGILKEAIPKLSRVAMVWDPRGLNESIRETERAAELLKVQLMSLEVRSRNDLENAFQSSVKSGAQAVIMGSSGFFNTLQAVIIELAAQQRLPVMYTEQEFVLAGGLMTYSTNVPELYRRAAWYVDKILKGAKPADLPVEQPTKFELVINMKTAKALRLTIPPSVLARADHVIQ